MPRVALIFPPATDPRAPHLALPALAAFLRRSGVKTTLLDLDIGSLLAVLRPTGLQRAAAAVEKQLAFASNQDQTKLRRLAAIAGFLAEKIAGALDVLRDPAAFFNANERSTARELVLDGLDLVSAAADSGVHYNLEVIRYDVDGVNANSLADLIRVTADPLANLFAQHWESEILPALRGQPYDVTGISICNRQQVIPGLTLARRLRGDGHFVVIGGPFFTKFSERLAHLPEFFDYFADAVVVREGETALLELVNQLNGGRDFGKVPNLLYRERDSVRATPAHIENLATLPPPDFGGLPLDDYLSPARVLPILAGKGCYYNACKFCDIPFPNTAGVKPYRLRPVDSIASDILWLNRNFHARYFLFTDEAMAPGLLVRLADRLRGCRHLDLRFAAYSRFEPGFRAGVLEWLSEMGLRRIFFGLESGSQKALDHMNKGIRLSNVRPILRNCAAAGISFHVFSMIGLPEETEEQARQTMGFFEENADVIDRLGNTLDIHPYEMQMQSGYASEAKRFGIEFQQDLLVGDFVVGIGRQWSNPRGLDSRSVDELLAEFVEGLHRKYRYQSWPARHWPALEEWSLLYADHYYARAFPYSATVPDIAGAAQFRLRWNPAALILPEDGKYSVVSRNGWVKLEADTFKALDQDGGAALKRLWYRDVIAALLRLNLLQLEPVEDAAAVPSKF